MTRLIFATKNADKVREIRQILEGSGFEVVTMTQAGIEADIVEDGTTFEENALIKARAVSRLSGHMAVADDSGLVIDALGGEPGIYSARYMGEDTPYEQKNAQLLERMKDVPDGQRSARFVCAVACVWPDGQEWTATAAMEGEIAREAAGENGFGYDPIFWLPEQGCTSAQLAPEEKNAVSHRGKAMRMLKERLS